MTTLATAPVLADLVPARRVRDAALVVSATALLTVAGQLAIPLPFTPVPLSLATFAVVLTGAALGPARAAATTVLYLALGLAGAPLFADGNAGWAFASFGYILAFVPASVLVGWGARRWSDRRVPSMLLAAAAGSAVIYLIGTAWLMAFLGVGLREGLTLGVIPFLAGDAIKVAAAALLLPSAWKAVNAFRPEV
ncbi:MAG: biotin transporter BioY, partial [Actinobacteria bacterium]|nr:biotin transporter BioY [Actinomycetota bacterium]